MVGKLKVMKGRAEKATDGRAKHGAKKRLDPVKKASKVRAAQATKPMRSAERKSKRAGK